MKFKHEVRHSFTRRTINQWKNRCQDTVDVDPRSLGFFKSGLHDFPASL